MILYVVILSGNFVQVRGKRRKLRVTNKNNLHVEEKQSEAPQIYRYGL